MEEPKSKLVSSHVMIEARSFILQRNILFSLSLMLCEIVVMQKKGTVISDTKREDSEGFGA